MRLCLSGSMLSSGVVGCGAGGGCRFTVWELSGGDVRNASGLTVSATCPFIVVPSVVLCIIAEVGGFTCETVVGVS